MKLIIPIFLCLSVLGASRVEKKVDINADGKIDRIEIYEDKDLIEVREDRNQDGKIDVITINKSATFSKQVRQDTNFDGNYDRIKTFKKVKESPNNKNAGKIQIRTQVDKDHNGSYEIDFYNYINPLQQTDSNPCPTPSLWDQGVLAFDILSREVNTILNGGFLMTGFGYKVEDACLKKWGENFPSLVKETMEQGIQCLDNLAKSSQKITGSSRLSYDLKELLKEDNVTILCTDMDDDPVYWEGVMAHASAHPSTKSSKGVKHPYMSINPFQPNTKKSSSKAEYEAEISELKKTLFHEQLHNLGFSHNQDIEYSFACEDCCLSYEDGNDEFLKTKHACNVCKGDYSNRGDLNYIRDMYSYGINSNNMGLVESATFNYLKENPNEPIGMAYLTKTLAANGNVIGKYIATAMEKKESIRSNPEARKIVAEVNKMETYENPDDMASPFIAASIYKLYVDRDISSTLSILEKHKSKISSAIKKLGQDEANSYKVYQIKTSLSNLMRDIYYNDYLMSDADNSVIRAQSLQKYFTQEIP
ncbi:hypothetical protein [Halobacteriovorax sp. DPLXC-1]|uniref:hypothetical protein n=1 Tax=Halobacteriovorax sp. DPLXC-1 TaxID=3110771 RepID=UPI002FEEAEBC